MNYSILFSAMLLLVPGREGQTQEAPLSINPDYSLKKGLKNPEMTEWLWLDCNPENVKRFISSSAGFKNLRVVCLSGGDRTTDWNKLMNSFSKLPLLYELQFRDNTLEVFPENIKKITGLQSLILRNTGLMDIEKVVAVLEHVPGLKSFEFDIRSLKDIPSNLCRLKTLSAITVNHTGHGSIELEERALRVTYSQPGPEKELLVKFRSDKNKFSIGDISALDGKLNCTDLHTQLFINYSVHAVERKHKPDQVELKQLAFSPLRKNIVPPIKGVDIEKTYFPVQAETGAELVCPGGTTIRIPAQAFVYKNGAPVTGDFVLDYREFRDPVEFLVSGIPMSGDSAGRLGYYESAGMFEINASQNGNPLYVSPGKNIGVGFVSTSDSPQFNFYAFNDTAGNWTDRGKEGSIRRQTGLSDITRAVSVYRQLYSTNKQSGTAYDSTDFYNRWKSLEYFYENRLNKSENKKPRMSVRKNKMSLTHSNNVMVSRYIRLKNIKKTKEGNILFRIQNPYRTHPELTYISSLWKTSQPYASATLFKKETGNSDYLNDVRIEENEGGYRIILKGINGFYTIEAIPVSSRKGKNGKLIIEEYKDGGKHMYKKYSLVMARRAKTFNTQLKKGLLQNNRHRDLDNSAEAESKAWKESKRFMNARENSMPFPAWKYYADSAYEKHLLSDAVNSAASSGNIIRNFSLGSTGIYNVDILKSLPNKVEILASYKNKGNEKRIPSVAFIIDKKSNSLIRFDGYMGYSPGKIAFNGKSENVLITFTNERIGVYYPADFGKNKFRNNQKFVFELDEMEAGLTSVADLRKAIGM